MAKAAPKPASQPPRKEVFSKWALDQMKQFAESLKKPAKKGKTLNGR